MSRNYYDKAAYIQIRIMEENDDENIRKIKEIKQLIKEYKNNKNIIIYERQYDDINNKTRRYLKITLEYEIKLNENYDLIYRSMLDQYKIKNKNREYELIYLYDFKDYMDDFKYSNNIFLEYIYNKFEEGKDKSNYMKGVLVDEIKRKMIMFFNNEV